MLLLHGCTSINAFFQPFSISFFKTMQGRLYVFFFFLLRGKPFEYFLQCYFLFKSLQGSGSQYKGIFDCVRTIVKEEGSHALLKVCSFLVFLFACWMWLSKCGAVIVIYEAWMLEKCLLISIGLISDMDTCLIQLDTYWIWQETTKK